MRPIIVAVDESTSCEAAVQFAHLLSTRLGLPLVALAAEEPVDAERTVEAAHAFERSAAERVRGWLPASIAGDLEVEIVPPPMYEGVTTRATQLGAAAVVVGAADARGHSRRSLGSPAHVLAHDLACPLVVVPDRYSTPITGNVVVGLDRSAASEEALHLGAHLATRLGGIAVGVYAIDDVYSTFESGGWFGSDEAGARRAAGTEPAAEFVERIGRSAPAVLTDLVTERHATLLVLAARERGSVGGVFLGDVPDELMHDAPCPVMILPYRYAGSWNRIVDPG